MKTISIWFGSLLLAGAASGWAQAAPKEADAFTEYFVGILRREAGSIPITVKEPLRLSVKGLDVSLGRVHAFCQVKPDDCEKAATYYAKSMLDVAKQQNAPISPSNVRLVIRPAAYLAQIKARLGDGSKLLARPLVAGWFVLPVLDTPHATRPLFEDDQKKLGLSEDALFKLAGDNVQAALPALAERAKPTQPGQIGTVSGDIYEVSRVALHGQWAELAAAQKGTLIVALPARDRLLYSAENTVQSTDALRALSKHTAAQSVDPLAPDLLLRWTAQGWELVQ